MDNRRKIILIRGGGQSKTCGEVDDIFVPDNCANCPDSNYCPAATDQFHRDYHEATTRPILCDSDPDGGYYDDPRTIERATLSEDM